jgi:hypothetical protein
MGNASKIYIAFESRVELGTGHHLRGSRIKNKESEDVALVFSNANSASKMLL